MHYLAFLFFVCSLIFCSCSPQQRISRTSVSGELKKQTGFELSEPDNYSEYPDEIITEDGITADEAIAIALWRNEQFQADLSAINIAAADVTDATLVNNPLLRYLTPNAGLMASGYINFAIDFIWQRPKRIAFAKGEAERTSATMIQRGYAIIRDVQNSFADLILSKEKAHLMRENAQIRHEMHLLAESQLKHGEISALEANTFRTDASAAADQYIIAATDTLVQYNTFKSLLGFRADTTMNVQPVVDSLVNQVLSLDSFMELTHTYQPELVAGRLSIQSAANKVGWERSRVVNFMGTLGFQHIPGRSGSSFLPNAFQPGIQAELPVFNRNQGKIERARAELEQATLQYRALQNRVLLDVINAYDRYEQAVKSLEIWNSSVLPTLAETVRLVRSSYERGDISYLPVLEAMRQLLNGRIRQAEIRAAIRKSISLLNYTIGQKRYIQ